MKSALTLSFDQLKTHQEVRVAFWKRDTSVLEKLAEIKAIFVSHVLDEVIMSLKYNINVDK